MQNIVEICVLAFIACLLFYVGRYMLTKGSNTLNGGTNKCAIPFLFPVKTRSTKKVQRIIENLTPETWFYTLDDTDEWYVFGGDLSADDPEDMYVGYFRTLQFLKVFCTESSVAPLTTSYTLIALMRHAKRVPQDVVRAEFEARLQTTIKYMADWKEGKVGEAVVYA